MSSAVNLNKIIIRQALLDDLPIILRMLIDDPLGSQREPSDLPDMNPYIRAFQAIDRDPNQELIVAELDQKIVGTFQISIIPNLTYQGGTRAQIESVRVDKDFRDLGIGTRMMQWAIGYAMEKGCALIQLSSHKSRTDAHRFYEKLGFEQSHLAMKYFLINRSVN